jgi:UDP-2-acetamido-3-amino-2,3-dideoxy-glucuronate N-acetyltransferase
MKIGLTTYDCPHLKTRQVLEGLISKKGYEVTLLELPFKKRDKRVTLFEHRPEMIQGIAAKELAVKHNINLISFDVSNLKEISELDYILIGGAQLIPKNLLLQNKIINCHCGLIPLVRGLDSFKWAVLNNNPLGNTLHFIDSSVDNGPVIFQKNLVLEQNDTIEDAAKRMYEEELEMLINFETYLKTPLSFNLPPRNPTKRMQNKLEEEMLKRFNQYKETMLMKKNVHSTAIIDEGAKIGLRTRVWHFSHVSPGAIIGDDCTLGQNTYVGNNVRIGNRCKIQNNVSIFESVILEDEVFCGPSMVFTNVKNPRSGVDRRDQFEITKVKKGASIGANVTIVCGTTIGEYSFIAAGAVITKDTEPFSLMAGVPAKRIGWMDKKGDRVSKQPNISELK